jgi:alpha-galactosidase
LRTIPVLLSMCRDMEEVCPDVTFLQYVNPMAMNCWAISRASSIKTVGLCHSVQGTAEQLAKDLGVPIKEINYVCGGINHMAFYLRFERDGEDLYPQLRKVAEEGSYGRRYRQLADKVRYEIFKRTGYFVTESSEHFSEYVPWFIKPNRPDLIEQYEIPLDEYITRCEVQITGWEFMRQKLEHPEQDVTAEFTAAMRSVGVTAKQMKPLLKHLDSLNEIKRSHEYGSGIIHSMVTGTPRVVYGNVPNNGLIDNLPQGCCVEVPCLVDKSGLQPTKIGTLPVQLAALMRTNVNVQELTVEAALTGKREYIYHAAMLDPHTAAELDLDQIWHLVDDLIEAHGNWLPEYK